MADSCWWTDKIDSLYRINMAKEPHVAAEKSPDRLFAPKMG